MKIDDDGVITLPVVVKRYGRLRLEFYADGSQTFSRGEESNTPRDNSARARLEQLERKIQQEKVK